jgi:hypothetical protein
MMAAKDTSIRWLYGPLEEENLRMEPEEANQSFSFSAVSIDSQSQSSVTERKRKRQTEDDVEQESRPRDKAARRKQGTAFITKCNANDVYCRLSTCSRKHKMEWRPGEPTTD